MARTRNIFISHSWTYTDAYQKLCTLLDKASNFSYRNYSVPKDDPVHNAPNTADLYAAIKSKIAFCEVVLIMAGKYATFSKWIQREIKIAKKDFSKPVVAIRPWANIKVSNVVRDNADQLVGWNTNTIVSVIRNVSP
jgi:Thoeris protein ThsB, TIR-like domain